MMERWKWVPGFEGVYEVSDLGRVRRVSYPLQQMEHPEDGHLVVHLGRSYQAGVHQLVASAFLGPASSGMEVRHKNGNPADNTVDNLEYATKSQNNLDRKWHRGTATGKLTPKDILAIRARLGRATQKVIAAEFGVCQTTISRIKLRQVHWDVAAAPDGLPLQVVL